MAAIEKICEFSDEYCSYDMYKYRQNHIQIHPKYRKFFAGASHTLHIESVTPVLVRKRSGGGLRYIAEAGYSDFKMADMNDYEPSFVNVREYKDYIAYFESERLIPLVEFTLQVHDKYLAGDVNGRYQNSTTDFQATQRRLKRMLKCKELNIVSHLDDNKTVGEFWREFLTKSAEFSIHNGPSGA